MISAIGISSSSASSNDSEYQRIIQELRSLGITPSGNKNTDKAKLEQAKTELIQNIQGKQDSQNDSQSLGVQTISQVDETNNSERAEMEEQRLGAMTISELNRLYFGI